jgi:signal transduction histidine kinase
VIRGRGPHYWLGGELGLALFRDGRFRNVLAKSGERFGTVTGIIATSDGALWLNEIRGVIRLPPDEVARIVADPHHRAGFRVFDFLDGLRGAPQMNWTVSTAVEAKDGRLWFANDGGLVWIRPGPLMKNNVRPPVMILSVVTDREYPATPGLTLPVGTEDVEIRYTAASLTIPERVSFRYRLEGVDTHWRDAGTRRDAFYNDLRPGRYRFHVIASNNDGLWNEEGASLSFSVAPAWYQTNAFRVLCAIGGVFMIWMLYRLRIRQIEAAVASRFDERLAERTRLARDIHDTLLQTIQGSKMVADHALGAPDDSRMRGAMQHLSEWLSRAMLEGRAALHSLRESTTQVNDLLEALKRATESEIVPRSMAVTCTVAGESREMHPIVRDEIYRIGYEAISNAGMHSGATRLSVELEYAGYLGVTVRDNGAGIDADVVETGKPDHFGLQGMRERAERIDARLTVTSAPGAGTTIHLVVPGGIAFLKERATALERLRASFRRH